MAQTTAYLGLGSNIGDRAGNLRSALGCLAAHMDVTTVSDMYETEPVGLENQESFLNLICCVRTSLTPGELLTVAKEIEVQLGRTPGVRNGPRTIDIDILLYGDLCLASRDLVIPHPRMTERLFVLVPLAAIAPDVVHPGLHATIRRLLEDCPDRHWVHPTIGGDNVSTLR
jgi:2-amino-4-hydroxy-6-hydroxymethyldihydropteridine diphosphokinase